MKQPVVMQHLVSGYIDGGGPATGMRLLISSKLQDKYRFIPLIQNKAPHGISISLLMDLVANIRKCKPDLIHVRGLHSEGFYAVLAAKIAGYGKIVLSIHGTYTDSLNVNGFKKYIFGKFLEPFTLRNADLVYTVCDYALKRPYIYNNTKKLYGFIHNAEPEYDLTLKPAIRERIRNELKIKNDELVIITVGRVTKGKGYEDIANAIKSIKTKIKFRYLIVGEGDYLNELKNKLSQEISEKMVFTLGKRSDVRDLLYASDIFVFPTLHENLSNSLLEACSAELAIIATNVGGNPEIIENNVSGILIPPNSPNLLGDAIITLALNHQTRIYFANNALNHVRIKFSRSLIFKQIEGAYDSILKYGDNN